MYISTGSRERTCWDWNTIDTIVQMTVIQISILVETCRHPNILITKSNTQMPRQQSQGIVTCRGINDSSTSQVLIFNQVRHRLRVCRAASRVLTQKAQEDNSLSTTIWCLKQQSTSLNSLSLLPHPG